MEKHKNKKKWWKFVRNLNTVCHGHLRTQNDMGHLYANLDKYWMSVFFMSWLFSSLWYILVVHFLFVLYFCNCRLHASHFVFNLRTKVHNSCKFNSGWDLIIRGRFLNKLQCIFYELIKAVFLLCDKGHHLGEVISFYFIFCCVRKEITYQT